MKFFTRMFAFFAGLFVPALALASVMDPGGLPFNPEDLSGLAQVLLAKMLAKDWVGLGASVVIVATFFGAKLLARKVDVSGHMKVGIAIGTSVLLGAATLFFSTPLAAITPLLVGQTVLTALITGIFGVGAVRTGQAAQAAFAKRQEEVTRAAEYAGQLAVVNALGAEPTDEQVAGVIQQGGK